MHYQRFLPWLWSFFKEWALPKFGIASAVGSVAAILFSLDPSAVIPDPAQKRFDSIFALTLNPWFQRSLYIFGTIFLAALAARHFANGRYRHLYFLDRNVPRFALVLNTIIGFLLLPMVVSIVALSMLPGEHTRQLELFSFTACAFTLFGACFHYMGGQDGHPRHSLVYAISSSDVGSSAEHYHYQTSIRLSEVLSHVPWHEGPVVTAETSDRQICLVVPIYLHVSSWAQSELTALNTYLSAIELEWRDAGFSVVRSESPEISFTLSASVTQNLPS